MNEHIKRKPPEWKMIARWVIGFIVVSIFCIATFIVLMGEDREMRLLVMGALIGAFSTITGFYFGSTEKDHD